MPHSRDSRRPSEGSGLGSHDSTHDWMSTTSSTADVASRVFNFAPQWFYAQLWHMKKLPGPTGSSETTSFITYRGPVSSEDMLNLYRERQLKGSNLIVGVASDVACERADGGKVGLWAGQGQQALHPNGSFAVPSLQALGLNSVSDACIRGSACSPCMAGGGVGGGRPRLTTSPRIPPHHTRAFLQQPRAGHPCCLLPHAGIPV